MGNGRFFRNIGGEITFFLYCCYGRSCSFVIADKAFECSFVRRKICRKSWGECPSCQDCIVINDRIVDCCGYGILRPGLLYRVGCTPYCQTCFGIFQSVIALICNLLCVLPGEAGIIPLNAITPVLGAPVIIYVIVNQKKIQYFN